MNNTVTFKVSGTEIKNFMDEIQKKADTMTANMISNARKQGVLAKDQIKDLEEQIKLLDKKNKLETEMARRAATKAKDESLQSYAQQRDEGIRITNERYEKGEISRKVRNMNINAYEAGFEEKVANTEADYKDYLKSLREQERQEALQTRLMKENIDTIRSTANTHLQQLRHGNREIVDELDDDDAQDPVNRLAKQLAKEERENEKQQNGGKESIAGGVLGGMLGFDTLKGLIGNAGKFASTQNGFDLIQPTSQGIGSLLGTIAGGIIGSFVAPGGGTLIGAGLGGQMGSMLGGTVGEFEQRRAMNAEDFLSARFRYEAQTGQKVSGVRDFTEIGISATEYLQILREIAVNTGNSALAAQHTDDVLTMEKGLGISQEVSNQMITYFRGTGKDISNLVDGIRLKGRDTLFAGGDTTFLNEFLSKFNQLHNELRSTTEKVATGATYDILQTFDRMGGQFAARDVRSSGLISNVNNALVNPGSDSTNALSFLALRQGNPTMGISQLLEERQKGLASPTYLQSMLEYIDRLGGDDDMKVMNTAGMFGLQGNIAAARRLFENRKSVGRMSQTEIEENFLGSDFTERAEARTTPIERNMADIKNGLLGTWYDSVDSMVDAFRVAMNTAFSGATIQMNNGSITFSGQSSVAQGQTNTLKTNK